jgi:hypothetical protein
LESRETRNKKRDKGRERQIKVKKIMEERDKARKTTE